ncbi:biliverdin-producing heme oxygenase [Bernardetia sp. ABR2-2B]|uniref:biliverdin-producing heme oxygenase n=1 Tax=Bernardetia sp. ABR2-2B TaxID=3127472 RepID=UPI0030D62B92
MSILQTVRTTTRSKHDLMEKLIGSDRLDKFSIDDYKLLLSTNYIFHSHLEDKARDLLSDYQQKNPIQATKLNFKERVKAISLEHELKNILAAENFEALKRIPNTVSFLDYYSLLGRLYVAEGSMLGGKMMHKILLQNPQINKSTTFDFFKNYESKTPRLWKSFKELVEEECQTETEKKQFLEGAEKSYLYFEKSFHKAKNILG